jgi:transcriptional regulator with XRE-family HTH domain
MNDPLFPALLRYWRGCRGLSQLDLALLADVSPRHVSFLESGRSKPSEAMVSRLMAALAVPLRDQNQALLAAGFPARFPEPGLHEVAPDVEDAITRMMHQQEPYPLTVLSPGYDVLRRNRAAGALFGHFIAEPAHLPTPLNMFSLIFDPRLARPHVANWEQVARHMLARLHRELLQRRANRSLGCLLERVLTYPDVPAAWRQPDLSTPCASTLQIQLHRDDLAVGFLTTLTVFSAPQQVTLDELRIEAYFPLDEETRYACNRLAHSPRPPAETLRQRHPEWAR